MLDKSFFDNDFELIMHDMASNVSAYLHTFTGETLTLRTINMANDGYLDFSIYPLDDKPLPRSESVNGNGEKWKEVVFDRVVLSYDQIAKISFSISEPKKNFGFSNSDKKSI